MFRSGFAAAMLLAACVLGTPATAGTTASGPAALPMLPWIRSAGPVPARRPFPSPWWMRPSLESESVLYSFSGPNGNTPNAVIRDTTGALYGTTFAGGSTSGMACGGYGLYGCGTVYKLMPIGPRRNAWRESVLYSFSGLDGALPFSGLLLDAHGNLYGTTNGGGSTGCGGYGCGTVFELKPPARGQTVWTENVLYAFTGAADGRAPQFGSLIAVNGSLYGTTYLGGTLGGGTVYQLTPSASGWTESVIHSFPVPGTSGDGSSPFAGLIKVGRALYDTTLEGGGIGCGGAGCGTVFQLTPPPPGQTAWTETVVYSFSGGPVDGAGPVTGLIRDPGGALYSTTVTGGSTTCSGLGCGTVFKLSPPAQGQTAWTGRVLHYFTGMDGYGPYSPITADQLGNLYGMNFLGGTSGAGTVFKLAPPAPGHQRWKASVLHDFTGGADGGYPYANNLIDDGSGTLLGETESGGTCAVSTSGCGVVFHLKE